MPGAAARVITGVTAIMVMVFLPVLLGADAAVKQMGPGLSVAILIDVTAVLLVLVPALMELFGGRTGGFPGRSGGLLPSRPAHAVGVRPGARV